MGTFETNRIDLRTAALVDRTLKNELHLMWEICRNQLRIVVLSGAISATGAPLSY